VPPASCPRCFPLQSPACRCVSPFPRRLEPCACTRRQLPSTTAAGPQAAAGSVASLPQKFPVPRQDRTVQGFPFYFFLAQNCANLWRCRNHRTVYDLPTMPLRQSFRPKKIYLTLLAGAMVLQYSSCRAHHVRCVVHQTGTPPPICHASLLVPPTPTPHGKRVGLPVSARRGRPEQPATGQHLLSCSGRGRFDDDTAGPRCRRFTRQRRDTKVARGPRVGSVQSAAAQPVCSINFRARRRRANERALILFELNAAE
jgi:hypothetical protein